MNKKTQGTEPLNHAPVEVPLEVAPVPQVPVYTPRPKTLERQGQRSEPYTHRMPEIRGGICEWCGVMDKNVPSQFQYTLCPHFRGLGEMRCSYCDDSINPEEVARTAVLHIAEHPDNPDKLVVWCDRYTCSGKHLTRFQVNI